MAEVNEFAQRPDVLGTDVALEPRCEWLSDVCRAEGGPADDRTGDMALYDIVYDEGSERVASHERAVIDVGSGQFDSWIAVPSTCYADPAAIAIFIARDE